jgi:hypothetical protein
MKGCFDKVDVQVVEVVRASWEVGVLTSMLTMGAYLQLVIGRRVAEVPEDRVVRSAEVRRSRHIIRNLGSEK